MQPGFYNLSDRELLSKVNSKSIDLVLTDPPYIISRDSGMQKMVDEGTSSEKYGTKYAYKTDYGDWDKDYTVADLEFAITEFYRVLRPGGSLIIFFDIWKIETLANLLQASKFNKLRLIEWVKTNPVPINSKATYLSNAKEIAISCVKGGKATFNSEYDNGIYTFPIYSGKERFHPTQKSLALFQELVRKHSNEGDLVLDPYAGSATTHCACISTGRTCISGEKGTDYFDEATKRLSLHSNL